jgi:hypothetical protein
MFEQEKKMGLLEAIEILHAGKYRTLRVTRCGSEAYWNPGNDSDWLMYRVAYSKVSKHRLLIRILKFTKVI